MCKEVYADFELAKLLYEKGFDWESNPFEDWQDRDAWVQQYHIEKPNPDYVPDLPFSSATITDGLPHVSLAVVMKWLREVHNLDIIAPPQFDNSKWTYSAIIFKLSIPCTEIRLNDNKDKKEQACEAAIKYCLENLV